MSKKKQADRNLDGVYFMVERNGEREPVCFSDLTDSEAEKVLANGWNAELLISLHSAIMGATKNVCRLIIDNGDVDELKVLCRTYGIA